MRRRLARYSAALLLLCACTLVNRLTALPSQPNMATATAAATAAAPPLRATQAAPLLQPTLIEPLPQPTRPAPLPLPTRAETPLPSNPAVEPPKLITENMSSPVLAAETAHFRLYTQDGYLPVDPNWWLAQLEPVYAYVSARLDGTDSAGKIAIGFLPPQPQACPVRGLASQDPTPAVLIFADENSSREYLLGVLAHEVGHAISANFAAGLPGSLAHTEGLATWASGRYGARWWGTADVDEYVRQLIAEGRYAPLPQITELSGVYPWQDAGEDCLARRDALYGEWGSFVGYLIETYGWEPAYRLFASPVRAENATPTPPAYEAIYGKTLEQLEQEWLAFLAW